MAHLNAYLSPCPGYGWMGGPEFKTQIVELQSGREKRNAMWRDARHNYNAPFNNISREAYREIKRMHLVCRGMLHSFRFRDQLDYQSDNEPFATGDGSQTVFQLAKVSSIDGVDYFRNVYAPVSPVSITADGSTVSPTIDYERGLVTFDTAPGAGVLLRWSGTFDVWVRFNSDSLPFTLDNPDHTNGSVDLLEVPPPHLV